MLMLLTTVLLLSLSTSSGIVGICAAAATAGGAYGFHIFPLGFIPLGTRIQDIYAFFFDGILITLMFAFLLLCDYRFVL